MGKLMRSNDRKIAGVCSGLAEYFGLDTGFVRLVTLILLFVSFGAVAIAYLLLTILLPIKGNKKSYSERMNERIAKK
ncbi:MAG: PspC domain-containing protein [Bacteroidaceae bacterium]|nr:PspC domain-containing protein [Bacteroidaceae bacterium]